MAARAAPDGLAGDVDGSGDDSDTGDPGFDLLPAAEKRKVLKQRRKKAKKASTVKATRSCPLLQTTQESDDDEVIIQPRTSGAPAAQPAAAAGEAATAAAEGRADILLSPTIAERNRQAPRDRTASEERRLREGGESFGFHRTIE